LLKESRFLEGVDVTDEEVGRTLRITINRERSNSSITEIVRVSTPGRRTYVSADNIPAVKRGRGLVVVSTNKGIMTGDQAKKLGVGGELICKVY
jgi:small subunit ribosomal protein S8